MNGQQNVNSIHRFYRIDSNRNRIVSVMSIELLFLDVWTHYHIEVYAIALYWDNFEWS